MKLVLICIKHMYINEIGTIEKKKYSTIPNGILHVTQFV